MTKLSHVNIVIISFLWGMAVFAYSPVLGQCLAKDATAFNDQRIIPYYYAGEFTSPDTSHKEKKWNGNYIGSRLFLVGLAAWMCGAGYYAFNEAFDGTNTAITGKLTHAQNTTVSVLMYPGLVLFFGGGALAIHYDKKHKTAVYYNGYRVGFAYNFR
jgi:hypothetical protein